MDAFLLRVATVNASPDGEYLRYVVRVLLFGSMLDSSRDKVGDVDLAIEVHKRHDDGDEYMRLQAQMVDRERQAGRQFRQYMDEIMWANRKLLTFLKGKGPVISLTEVDDAVLEVAESREVYRFAPPPGSRRINLI